MTGKGFEALRKLNGIIRADFARFCKLNYNTIYQWERCRKPPGYGVKLLLAYIDKVKAMRQAAEPKKNSAV